MNKGFEYFDEEDFYECFRDYRGSVPNMNNSDYTSKKINLFLNVDYDDVGDIIKNTSSKIKSYFNDNYVIKIDTDLDDSDSKIGLLFFDVFLKSDTPKEELSKGLKLINENL